MEYIVFVEYQEFSCCFRDCVSIAWDKLGLEFCHAIHAYYRLSFVFKRKREYTVVLNADCNF